MGFEYGSASVKEGSVGLEGAEVGGCISMSNCQHGERLAFQRMYNADRSLVLDWVVEGLKRIG